MLCPPQYVNGPLSKALTPLASNTGVQHGDGSDFASFIRRATADSAASKAHDHPQAGPSSSSNLLPVLRVKATSVIAKPPSKAKRTDSNTDINQIGRSIRSIFATPIGSARLDSAGQSYESLYRSVGKVVLENSQGKDLYDRIRLELERAVGQLSHTLRGGVGDDVDAQRAWLVKFQAAWEAWRERTMLTCRILTLLDQVYTTQSGLIRPLATLSTDLFKDSIAANDELKAQAFSCITGVCNGIRDGRAMPLYRVLHISLVAMYSDLALYQKLEESLIDATRSYFDLFAKQAIESLDKTAYLLQAQQRIENERQNNEWLYTSPGGRKRSIAIAYDQVFKVHTDNLVAGLPEMLADSSATALPLLYESLETVKMLQPLRTAFVEYVRKEGEAIVTDRANDDTMIDRLLTFKLRIGGIVSSAFKNNTDFQQAQRDAFEVFVNRRENKAAELIAKFLDEKLRSGNKTMSDQEMESVLNEALALFRFTHAKDMFEEFYKRLFAKRLLLNRSASSDAEQSMLLKLKEECGSAFTLKLETMLTDIALSDDMMKAYSSSREKVIAEAGKPDEFEMNVNVLTQAHWPTYPQVEIIVPADLAAATDSFAEFYETRNQGRKLQWAHTLGTTSLTAHFAKAGEKELLVSTFQTIVLLLFNPLPSGAKLTYAQIKAQTGLVDKELKRTLQSLACGQIPTRVLRKDPQGKEVEEQDTFSVNEQLKNDRKRIRINMIQMTETKEEQKSTVDRVMFDREMVLQATTVRILKAKKTIKHAELLQEVVQSIAARFTVDVAEIKKTFEILIDKEYMERVEGQRGVYQYLA